MRFSAKTIRGLLVSVIVLTLTVAALGDTIRLKDGSLIKGKILSFSNGKFIVLVGEGSRSRQLTFNAAEIDSITFDQIEPGAAGTQKASYETPASTGAPKVVTTDNTSVVSSPKPSPPAAAKPIVWNVRVTADNTANGWTNTGWVVKKGQRIRISGDGKVSLGGGKSSPPAGLPDLRDDNKLLKNVPTGALIAVIGDDNNDFIFIGASREIVATRDGSLFLGVNEGNLDDNSGTFSVKIEVFPEN